MRKARTIEELDALTAQAMCERDILTQAAYRHLLSLRELGQDARAYWSGGESLGHPCVWAYDRRFTAEEWNAHTLAGALRLAEELIRPYRVYHIMAYDCRRPVSVGCILGTYESEAVADRICQGLRRAACLHTPGSHSIVYFVHAEERTPSPLEPSTRWAQAARRALHARHTD